MAGLTQLRNGSVLHPRVEATNNQSMSTAELSQVSRWVNFIPNVANGFGTATHSNASNEYNASTMLLAPAARNKAASLIALLELPVRIRQLCCPVPEVRAPRHVTLVSDVALLGSALAEYRATVACVSSAKPASAAW